MKRIVLACLLLCLTAVGVFAQATAGLGGLTGVIADQTGAPIPAAQVIVANEEKGIRRTLETNADGIFNAPALVPASGYSVTVDKTGFQQFQQKDITVLVGQNVDLKIALGIAASATSVDVDTTPPIVDTTKTDVSQVVDSRQIIDLPINGRRVDSFVLLTPAVVPDGTFGLLSFRGVAGHNTFLTDGNDTTNQFYNENAGRTRIASQISQDAVQEFQVVSDNYSAEFGQAMGGVVNTVTRSGTNGTHGTAYWFFRNQDFNARDRYASFNPDETRHQVGGSLGGAIIKNKLFYFMNYEKTLRDFPLIASVTQQPLFNSAGAFTGTCGLPTTVGNKTDTPTAAQCQAATNFIPTRNFATVGRSVDQNLGFVKLDFRPVERHTLSVSGNLLNWDSPNGIQTQAVLNNGNGIGNNANSNVRTRYGRADWTYIVSPTVISETRFGYFKDRLFDDASSDFFDPALGRAGLTINGVTNLGYATSYPRLNPSEQRFEGANNTSISAGRHAIKFGFDVSAVEDYQNQLSNQYGTYTYTSFSDWALDFSGNTTGAKHYSTYQQRFGNPIVDTNLTNYGTYVQDQFRVTPRLQINFGVRYDYADIQQPSLFNSDYPRTGIIPTPGLNFAPRTGISYSMFGGKTVLRGGYGLFYARYQTGLVNTLFINNNLYQKQITLDVTRPADLPLGPVYPNNLAGIDRNPPAGTTDITLADKDLRNPYTHQANFSIDHQLTSNMNLTVSYLWSRGVNLYTIRDLNVGALGAVVTYPINDLSGNTVGSYSTPTYRLANRVDSRYRRVNQVENGGLSYYDGLAVQLNKRFSKGLQGNIAYTWSHAIDFNQGAGTDNIFFSGAPTSYYNGNFTGEKGSSALDIRHRLVINSVWQPTFSSGNDWFVRNFINGWQLSQITTIQSAPPSTATVTVNGSAFSGAAFSGSLNGLGGSTRVPFEQINGLRAEDVYRVDARISRAVSFTENMKLWLTFEAFNVFNTQYDTSLRTAEYQLSGGALVPFSNFGQGTASQAFPDGTNARRAQVGLRLTF